MDEDSSAHHLDPSSQDERQAPDGTDRPLRRRTSVRTGRCRQRAAEALTDTELIAALLQRGHDGASAHDLAEQLLDSVGGIHRIGGRESVIAKQPGIGERKAAVLLAAHELACRLAEAPLRRRRIIGSPASVARFLTLRFPIVDQERAGAVFLDAGNHLVATREFFRGTIAGAYVEPRQIFRTAIELAAPSLVLFHCHPSGDPSPSREDIRFTHLMRSGGEILGIRVADHLVLGLEGRFFSMRQSRDWKSKP